MLYATIWYEAQFAYHSRICLCFDPCAPVRALLVGHAEQTLAQVRGGSLLTLAAIEELSLHVGFAKKLSDQIRRRRLERKVIPQCAKIYSIFEPHTRWIAKAKAGCAQELDVCFRTSTGSFCIMR